MTLEEFLEQRYPPNSFIERDGWETLYVRKGTIGVNIDGKLYKVHKVFTLARIAAEEPGNGLFTGLVKHLVELGWAIYVECVHTPLFQVGLRKRGFLELKTEGAPNYLFNHEDHLHKWKLS